MSGAQSPRIAVVLAHAGGGVDPLPSLQAFTREVQGHGQVWLVCAGEDASVRDAVAAISHVGLIIEPEAWLVPELWLAGYSASDATLVAFSTTAMIPSPGWLNTLCARLETSGAAGVGGPIAPPRDLRPFDRALFLHRFVRYLPPLPNSAIAGPAGENALYRREHLESVRAEFGGGFWEVEVQRHLRERGHGFAAASEAIVTYYGGARRLSIWRQRLAHTRRYAQTRMATWSKPKRFARALCAPFVPAVLLARTIAELRTRHEPLSRWARALPDLLILLALWSAGEAIETVRGLRGRTAQAPAAGKPRSAAWAQLANTR
jgi:hypothetical protein